MSKNPPPVFTLLFTCTLLLIFDLSIAGTYQQNADTSLSITKYALAGDNSQLKSAIPTDLNQDGYLDLLYHIAVETSSYSWTQKIYFLPGTEAGFDSTGIIPLFEDSNVNNVFLGDWDSDSNTDIIVQKSRKAPGGGYIGDLVQVYYLDKTSITDTTTFSVPFEVYLGNETNPKELQQLLDIDLDGRVDMIFAGFSHVTIGWNNGENTPEFHEITNKGYNTYNSRILDYNQDGYPDIINDDQYSNRPVIHLNKKDRSFSPKISSDLPEWSITNPSSMYWGFESFWLNDDHFPDLLARKAGNQLGGSHFEIYEYNMDEESYSKSSLQFPDNNKYGEITPFHFNNDGYIDFIEVNIDKFKVWLNNENSSFSTFELDISTGYSVENLYKVDADNDGDLDILFSFTSEDILFQIENTEAIVNEAPAPPSVDNLSVLEDVVNIEWKESLDDQALTGHIEYNIELTKDAKLIDVRLHSNNINLENLPAGNYSLNFTASDPLGYKSDVTETFSFVILSTDIKAENEIQEYKLHQNYPNPFNPTTTISYQLNQSSLVQLEVFDITGRKVAILVNAERKSTGTYQATFDAENLASGFYFYRLETAGQVLTKKMLLVK